MPIFENIADADLECMVPLAHELTLPEGGILFNEGDPASGLYILLEGELEISKLIGGRSVVLEIYQPGVFVGEISLLTGLPHTAAGRALMPSRFLHYPPSLFASLQTSPVARLLLSTMAQRVRATEALVQQNEKLSALGRLSAGLAHELNNPASASLRAAKQLPETLAALQELLLNLNRLNLTPEQIQMVVALQLRLVEAMRSAPPLDALALSDREDILATWIDAHGGGNGWELAPILAQAHATPADLDALLGTVAADTVDEVLRWLNGMLTMHSLLYTLESSTMRISELIGAVRAYSYMDQSPVQTVDIHEGLDNTLVILGHKLQNVTVKRDYDRTIPPLTVYGSELNQVWTNLIDNAIDATEGRGRLTIRTWREGDCVVVEIADDGCGIPPQHLSRIFEPFFTTKAVGEGAGLGLDAAYRIVVNRHEGDIRVTSRPGDTRFQVSLPIRLQVE
jgi:signal transduction histidine kinase